MSYNRGIQLFLRTLTEINCAGFLMWSVFFSYCHVRNQPPLGSSKQPLSYLVVSVMTVGWVLCSRSHQAELRVWPQGLTKSQGARPSSPGCWESPVPAAYSPEAPVFSLTVSSWNLPQVLAMWLTAVCFSQCFASSRRWGALEKVTQSPCHVM